MNLITNLEPTLTPNDADKVRALLQCWAEWRGTVRQALLSHMKPRCTLGRLVAAARQEGELWAHNEIHEPQVDDALMSRVDRLVCDLSRDQLEVVKITYTYGRHWTARKRSKRLHLSKREYYYRLREAHERIYDGIDWRNVFVA